jgi:hypothetical protein
MPNNSKGCLIVAFDTVEVCYTQQAIEAANRVVKHLGIPVSIVTDNVSLDTIYNKIIVERPQNNRRHPRNKSASDWYNLVRTSLYDLSPYERTLVIDSDFFISTDSLLPHLNSSRDFLIAKEIYDLTRGQKKIEKIYSSPIVMYWATVMIFNKSFEAEAIFNAAKMVESNYKFYANLYGFIAIPIRNDFIFSIACHLIGGYGIKNYGLVNYPLINCDSKIKYVSWKDEKLIYKYEGEAWINRIKNADLHLMNKVQE